MKIFIALLILSGFLLFIFRKRKNEIVPVKKNMDSISIDINTKYLKIAEKNLANIISSYVLSDDKNIHKKIHKNIITSFSKGARAESLCKEILGMLDIEQSAANSLAFHALSYLSAKYRQAKYEDMGCKKYRWSSSKDERVREDHKILEGKIFQWDNPPIANRKTGERYNPGEVCGCRCIAVPIIE